MATDTLPREIYVELAPDEFEGRDYEWGGSHNVDNGMPHCALSHRLRVEFPVVWFRVDIDYVVFHVDDQRIVYTIPKRSAKLLKINHLRAALGEGAKPQRFTLKRQA